jgi:hypothetical protein
MVLNFEIAMKVRC